MATIAQSSQQTVEIETEESQKKPDAEGDELVVTKPVVSSVSLFTIYNSVVKSTIVVTSF